MTGDTTPTRGENRAQRLRTDGGSQPSDDTGSESTHPTIKPTVIKLVLVMVATAAIAGYFFDSARQSDNAAWVAIALGALVSLRYLWLMLILYRTRYIVNADSVVHQYRLFGKVKRRQLPIRELRGTEITTSRIQSLFGVGTVQFLTGGMNQSLGFIRFSSIPNPGKVQDLIEKRQQR